MQVHVAFLMRRHRSLPIDALQKPLTGHSLSAPTYAGKRFKIWGRQRKYYTLPASTGWCDKLQNLASRTLSFSQHLAFSFCFLATLSLFPWKISFLIPPFTAPGSSNCCCIRMDTDAPAGRTLNAGAPWVPVLQRHQHLLHSNDTELAHPPLPWIWNKSFKESNMHSSWIAN